MPARDDLADPERRAVVSCERRAAQRSPVSRRQRRLTRRERAGQRAGDATRARPTLRWAARTVLKENGLSSRLLDSATRKQSWAAAHWWRRLVPARVEQAATRWLPTMPSRGAASAHNTYAAGLHDESARQSERGHAVSDAPSELARPPQPRSPPGVGGFELLRNSETSNDFYLSSIVAHLENDFASATALYLGYCRGLGCREREGFSTFRFSCDVLTLCFL